MALWGEVVGVVPGIEPDETAGTLWTWLSAHPDAPDPLVLSNNDPVATWPDSGPAARDHAQGTAANRPTFKTDVLGTGLHGVLFDGVNDRLTNSDNPSVNDAQCVAVVSHSPSPTSDDYAVWQGAAVGDPIKFFSRTDDGNGNWAAIHVSAYGNSTIILPTDDTPHVITFLKHPSTSGPTDTHNRRYIRVDGTYYDDTTGGGVSGSHTDSVIGGSLTGTNILKGYIFEVAVWSGGSNCNSDAEIQAVEERLASRWGISLP